MGKTLSLFQIENGDCIGGFTDSNWTIGVDFKYDAKAMLFNLSTEAIFPC